MCTARSLAHHRPLCVVQEIPAALIQTLNTALVPGGKFHGHKADAAIFYFIMTAGVNATRGVRAMLTSSALQRTWPLTRYDKLQHCSATMTGSLGVGLQASPKEFHDLARPVVEGQLAQQYQSSYDTLPDSGSVAPGQTAKPLSLRGAGSVQGSVPASATAQFISDFERLLGTPCLFCSTSVLPAVECAEKQAECGAGRSPGWCQLCLARQSRQVDSAVAETAITEGDIKKFAMRQLSAPDFTVN